MSAPVTTPVPRQWWHCVGSTDMHYFSAGAPLCGAPALTTARPMVVQQSKRSRPTDAAPRCRECDRRHGLLWRKGGAL